MTEKPPGTASFVAVLPVLSQLWRIRLGARHGIGGDLVMTWRPTGRAVGSVEVAGTHSFGSAAEFLACAIVIVMGTAWLGSLFGFFCATVGDCRWRLIMHTASSARAWAGCRVAWPEASLRGVRGVRGGAARIMG